MKKRFLVLPLLLLTGCSPTVKQSASLEQYLNNPLYAKQFYTELTDEMVNIEIREPDTLKDKHEASLIRNTKDHSLNLAQLETQKMNSGTTGNFVQVKQSTQGTVLLTQQGLFFGTDFTVEPGPSLHVYLTNAVDPRDVAFPDPSAKDIGLIASPYGAQSYALALTPDELKKYRTVVLLDRELNRIYGFAQLSK